jgi:hypothetical protein
MLRFALSLPLACFSLTSASAATLLLGASFEGYVPALEENEFVSGFDERDYNSVSDGPLQSLTVQASESETAYIARAAADSNAGALSTGATITESPESYNSASALSWVSEELNVSGTGSVTFVMRLSGDWAVDALEEYGGIFLIGDMLLNTEDEFNRIATYGLFQEEPDYVASGVVDEILWYELAVDGEQKYEFFASSFVSIGNVAQNGAVSLAASLSIEPSDGVLLAFSDPAFLGGSSPAPIPLPAGGVMLLSGLAIGGALVRGRSARHVERP